MLLPHVIVLQVFCLLLGALLLFILEMLDFWSMLSALPFALLPMAHRQEERTGKPGDHDAYCDTTAPGGAAERSTAPPDTVASSSSSSTDGTTSTTAGDDEEKAGGSFDAHPSPKRGGCEACLLYTSPSPRDS